ncbi:MAG: pyruvate kinase [Chloroflexota bacterium]
MDRPRTKQVCTIGPASAEKIAELVLAGMDVARVNFSHGTPEDHKAYIHGVRSAAHSARRSVATLVDLPGPKLRLGDFDGGEARLTTGSTFTLRAAPSEAKPEPKPEPKPEVAAEVEAQVAEGPPEAPEEEPAAEPEAAPEPAPVADAETEEEADTTAHLQAPAQPTADASGAVVRSGDLSSQLQVGDRVLLADGAVELKVSAVEPGVVTTEVINGGLIRSRSGVNIPSARFIGNGLTDADRAGVTQALELRADLIAQSFVRSAADVQALRALLPTDGPRLVAKIETDAAVNDFDAICAAADGIMVARGDLGVDVPFETVPLIQKDLIERARAQGKFAIVATQMLESMTDAPRPTRAEASDVANAVLDGADGVMLSAETAIGAYPVEALQAMERICLAAERAPSAARTANDPATSIVYAAAMTSDYTQVGAVWCFTRTGRTADLLSQYRPRVPIIAFTLSPVVARRLAVRGGVIPLVLPAAGKNAPLVEQMEAAWRSQKPAGDYDTVLLVTTSAQPTGINRLEIHHLSGASAKR